MEQLRVRTERAEKKASVATGKVAASEANAAFITAESPTLFSSNLRDPRLTFQGRVLARSLNEKARKEIEREARRAEVAERAAERAVQRAKKSEAQSLPIFSLLAGAYLVTTNILASQKILSVLRKRALLKFQS